MAEIRQSQVQRLDIHTAPDGFRLWALGFEREEQMSAPKNYGWYSELAAKLGTFFWLDKNGNEVEVTAIVNVAECENPSEYPPYGWPDKQYIGELSHWSRDGRKPDLIYRELSA